MRWIMESLTRNHSRGHWHLLGSAPGFAIQFNSLPLKHRARHEYLTNPKLRCRSMPTPETSVPVVGLRLLLRGQPAKAKASRLCDDDGEMSSAESKGRGNLHQRRARGRRPIPNCQFAWLYLTAVTTLQTATAGAEYGSPARYCSQVTLKASHLSHLTFLPTPFAHLPIAERCGPRAVRRRLVRKGKGRSKRRGARNGTS